MSERTIAVTFTEAQARAILHELVWTGAIEKDAFYSPELTTLLAIYRVLVAALAETHESAAGHTQLVLEGAS